MPTERFWQERNDTRECTILIGSFKKRSEDINEKTRWYNGFWDEKAVCCMDCQQERRLGSGHGGDDYLFTSESVRLAPTLVFLSFFFLFTYVHTEGFELIKTCREHTHKYCLFLASLRAASVWSLLKSPESDSKMSSIGILAFDLHKSLIVVKDAQCCYSRRTGSLALRMCLSTTPLRESSKFDWDLHVDSRMLFCMYVLTERRVGSDRLLMADVVCLTQIEDRKSATWTELCGSLQSITPCPSWPSC